MDTNGGSYFILFLALDPFEELLAADGILLEQHLSLFIRAF